MSPDYLLTSLVIILLPGTGVIYTLAWGLGHGWRASVLAAFGCTLGIVPHIIISILGLAALLHASAMAFQVIKYLGVAYLLFMAWTVLHDSGPLQIGEERSAAPALTIISHGILLNILNPKLSLFFLAFLPQFVSPASSSPTLTMLGLAGIFMVLTFIVFVGYGACASVARSYVISQPSVLIWLRRCFAGAFAVLGLRLVLSDH